MSAGLVSEDGGGWWAIQMACTCLGGFLFGGSNTERWGDHQKMNFFINNFVEALILLKDRHQSLLNLHVYILGRGGSSVGGNQLSPKRNFIWSRKITRRLFRKSWNLVYLLEGAWRALMKKKWGGNRRKSFYKRVIPVRFKSSSNFYHLFVFYESNISWKFQLHSSIQSHFMAV